MNAEHLHVVAKAIRDDLDESSLVNHFQELTTALQNLVNTPSHPQYQQIITNKLTEIYSALENARSNSFSPAWQQIANDIGGAGLLGVSLENRIRTIFERNQITLPVAFQEITQINLDLIGFKSGIDQTVNGLSQLKIEAKDLGPGECEVGVAIPRRALEDDLKAFAEELGQLAFIVGTFVELSSGKHEELPIRTVSSSDFLIYVGVGLWAARSAAYATEHIIENYKKILEIRKLKAEAHRLGLPQNTVTGIEEYATSEMTKTVDDVTLQIMAKFSVVKDAGRKNELTTRLRFSLNKIANRVDKGYNFEVRIGPPTEEQKEDPNTAEAVAIIQTASSSLQFIRLEGEPILLLPEAAVEETKETHKTTSKK